MDDTLLPFIMTNTDFHKDKFYTQWAVKEGVYGTDYEGPVLLQIADILHPIDAGMVVGGESGEEGAGKKRKRA